MVSEHGFTRIRKLPEDRLTFVNNWLMRGGEVMQLARTIQQEWAIWADINEKTLQQQLNRYRRWLARNDPAEVLPEGAKRTRIREIDVMERMVSLVSIQEKRLKTFLEKEEQLKMPIAGIDKVIDSTKELLKDIQKVRFDLGMDEFKGVLPGVQVRAGQQTVTRAPDGTTTTTTQVLEAMTMADQILGRANIPSNLKLLERTDGVDPQG